jgi:hypothetical protein
MEGESGDMTNHARGKTAILHISDNNKQGFMG